MLLRELVELAGEEIIIALAFPPRPIPPGQVQEASISNHDTTQAKIDVSTARIIVHIDQTSVTVKASSSDYTPAPSPPP
jgi:hypothetical protein